MKTRPALTVTALALASTLAACAPAQTGPLPDPATYRIAPADVAQGVPEVGEVGRWMVTGSLQNATWLGEPFQGRTLREAINVILIDRTARTPEQATARLMDAMTLVGYGPKNMHSDGYSGYINGRLYAQQPPSGKGLAFSDGPWYASNNHGRLFGPASVTGGFVFIGSLSREDFRVLPSPGHTYNSFRVAREDLADRLNARTPFKRTGYVDLNSRLDTPQETTGDHDGRAVVLVATP